MNNPEDPNEVYIRLTDVERRLDELDEKHDKLREDYTYGINGGRRKTRRKKNKKKRYIITRKNKRKRRRRTKKKRKGGMPKNSTQSKAIDKRIAQLKKSTLSKIGKPKLKRSRLTRSPSVRMHLNKMSNSVSPKFKPIVKETEEQSKKVDEGLDNELSNIFRNMRTPTEGERTHNIAKTFESPKPK